MSLEFDIAIVGSGLTGNSTSLALEKAGYKIALIDPMKFATSKNFSEDTRTTAISKKAKEFFQAIGVWKHINTYACPIKNIIVKDNDNNDNVSFFQKKNKQSIIPMGYMIENKRLSSQLISLVSKKKNIRKFDAKILNFFRSESHVTVNLSDNRKIKCLLLIGADGRKSYVRKLAEIKHMEKNYHQKAFIFNVKHDKKHNYLAVENFLEYGPLAALPIKKNNDLYYSSIVWTSNYPNYLKFLNADNKKKNLFLNHYLSNFYGNLKIATEIKNWDLFLIHANKYIDYRIILLGDAAHALHPLAGQGFNLTIRGLEKFYYLSLKAKSMKKDIGDFSFLAEYNKNHYLDAKAIIFATDKLNFLFSNSNFFLKQIRKQGINFFNKNSLIKNIFRNYASEGKISIR